MSIVPEDNHCPVGGRGGLDRVDSRSLGIVPPPGQDAEIEKILLGIALNGQHTFPLVELIELPKVGRGFAPLRLL